MPASSNPNIKMLELAVERLGTLVNEVVFLGGCATGLLLTDTAAPPIRITLDVDVMVEWENREKPATRNPKHPDQ